MGIFRFKKFSVVNERSAMKVNTDGVLLGAAMTLNARMKKALDIGTGTGTIALMAAQRLSDGFSDTSRELTIDAIDIDDVSVEEASVNFAESPWQDMLKAHHVSLEAFDVNLGEDAEYDLIFSNPPYFESSLPAPEERRCVARHSDTGLSYREILDFASRRLSEEGVVSFVLPADLETGLMRHARMNGLFPFRILRVRTVQRKVPSRIIVEFSRHRCENVSEEMLTIQNRGKYTQEYLSLTCEFYLFA